MSTQPQPMDTARSPRDGLSPDCPVLLTENLVLRAPHAEDIDAIAILANNPSVATMLSRMPHPYGRSDALEFVRKSALGGNGNCVYAMTEARTGHFVGCCALRTHSEDALPEIGYWVGEPHWGRGHATEAAHALIDMAFSTRDIIHIDARCRITNPASRRVLQKSGFQHQGSCMVNVLALGATVAMDRYRLDRRTWVSLVNWSARPGRMSSRRAGS